MTSPVSLLKTLPIEEVFLEAVALHRAGHLKDADDLYRAILSVQPTHPDANHNLGVVAILRGLPATGLSCLKSALEADPGNGQYWLSYIEALIQTGQADTARQVLEDARQRGLQGAEADELAARLTIEKPAPQEIETLQHIFNQGRYAEAAALAQEMTFNFPRHGASWAALGAALKQLGLNEEALRAMQKSVALAPEDFNAQHNLGIVLRDMVRLEEAEISFRQALRIKPDYADAYNNLGIVLLAQGRLEEAEACFRQAIQINPDDADARDNLGRALLQLGKMDEAENFPNRADDPHSNRFDIR